MSTVSTRSPTNGKQPKLAPGPQGGLLAMLSNMVGVRRQGLLAGPIDSWRQYGDVVRIEMGPVVMHQFVRPEHVRYIFVQNWENFRKGASHDKLRIALGNGLLTSEGPFWQRQRRLMQPSYTPTGVAQYADIMVDATQRMLERWQGVAKRGQALVVNQEMMHITMSVISRSMFGVDISENFAEAGHALRFILEFAAQRTVTFIDPPMFLPTPLNRRLKKALQTIDGFLYGIIDERRRHDPGHDLLSLLMQARDEETGESMSRTQLRDEALITFFAGHETTAQLLTWTWYLLSRNPHSEERLHAEVDSVLGGRRPTLQDTPNLSYTRMIIDEALRLYSPVAMTARDVVEDDEIDGYHIPADSMVIVLPFITHRHPEFWEEPEVFNPERFTPERIKSRPRYAYYPFGAGPRICIGNHFALLEATLILADVAQRYQLRLASDQVVEPEVVGTLRPSSDVLMTLHPR